MICMVKKTATLDLFVLNLLTSSSLHLNLNLVLVNASCALKYSVYWQIALQLVRQVETNDDAIEPKKAEEIFDETGTATIQKENPVLIESSDSEHSDENSKLDEMDTNPPADQSLSVDNKSTDMEVV